MTITADSTVGAVATEHPLATRVFARRGIDFCCAGGQALALEPSASGLGTVAIDIEDTGRGSARGEEAGDREADAARPPGDDRDLAFEFGLRHPPPPHTMM